MSEPKRLCYPYLESIKSFVPICDEIIVVYNCLPDYQDGSLVEIASIDDKVKVISGLFDYKRFGWASQGIMRTNGYYACTGDVAIMFDADGILHEQDYNHIITELDKFNNSDRAYGFFMKKRFNQAETWVRQCKHSGFYSKAKLGNSFNFYGRGGNYAPNWEILPEQYSRGQQIDCWIYGYERLWDNEIIFKYKMENRRIMERSIGIEVPPLKQYIQDFMQERWDKMAKEGQKLNIEQQPKIIQAKLRNIQPDQFGYNMFR